MAVPAVPDYVTRAAGAFADCPAGHRFSLYLPAWDAAWQIAAGDKARAASSSRALGNAAKVLAGINARQSALATAAAAETCLVIEALSTAPFATGLGIEHPIENGFAFLSPYGLPYLAGSGVKGVLRRAAEALHAEGELSDAVVQRLFGHEDANDLRRGALRCWDVFPEPPKGELVVEVMTPHFSDYYQKGGTPNDSGKPNPIPFLAVPAGSRFRLILLCDQALLGDALIDVDWKTETRKIIDYAFDWLGFGAKTAVGYGAVARDEAASARREAEGAQRARKAATLAKSPKLQQVDAFIELAEKRYTELRGNKVAVGDAFMNAVRILVKDALEGEGWAADEKLAVVQAVENWMPKIVNADMKDQRKKLKLTLLRGSA